MSWSEKWVKVMAAPFTPFVVPAAKSSGNRIFESSTEKLMSFSIFIFLRFVWVIRCDCHFCVPSLNQLDLPGSGFIVKMSAQNQNACARPRLSNYCHVRSYFALR